MNDTTNVSSAEYVFNLTPNEAETVYLSVVNQLLMEGEQEWDIEAQAHKIMDNVKHYPEFFPQLC